jgi:hypothetical protein
MDVSSVVNEYIIVFRHNEGARNFFNSWLKVNPIDKTKRFKLAYFRLVKRARSLAYKRGLVKISIKPHELDELCEAMYYTLT